MWLLFGRWQGWLSALMFCPPLGSFLSGCEDVQCLAQLFIGRMMLEFGSLEAKDKESRVARECGSEEAMPSAVPLRCLSARAGAGAVSPERKERAGCLWSCSHIQRHVKTPGHEPVPEH